MQNTNQIVDDKDMALKNEIMEILKEQWLKEELLKKEIISILKDCYDSNNSVNDITNNMDDLSIIDAEIQLRKQMNESEEKTMQTKIDA